MIKDCPYPQFSGVEDAEIISDYCEIGCGCYDQCDYSWKLDDEEMVNKLFEEYCIKEAM